MNCRNIISATAILCALSIASHAQNSSLEGEVKGADGKPVQNAIIRIQRTDVQRSFQVKTDRRGFYQYNALPIGFYMIVVQVDGRDVAGVTGIRTQPGDPMRISFDLGATPEDQLKTIRQEIRRVGGEWSLSRILRPQPAPKAVGTETPQQPVQAPSPQPAEQEKAAAERAVQLKQREELNTAMAAATEALEAKRFDEAAALFAKLSDAEPKQAVIWVNLGAAYAGLAAGKSGPEAAATMQKALDAYAKAVELKPEDAGAHRIYGNALARAKKFPEMEAELKKAAELAPASAYQVYYNAGAVLVNTGENDRAAEVFRMAVAAAPEEPLNAESYFQYGMALVGKAQVGADGKVIPAAGTVEAFQKYLQLAPEGRNAQNAKNMIATLGASFDTRATGSKVKKK